MKIVFLDIDGPMIPFRAYYMKNQTKPVVTIFDPVAVGLLNRLCAVSGAKIVIHSHWRKSPIHHQGIDDLKEHLLFQGISSEHFHTKYLCPEPFYNSDRWDDIELWLADTKEKIENYVIIEDTDLPDDFQHFKNNLCQVTFDEGFTYERYCHAVNILGADDPHINGLIR